MTYPLEEISGNQFTSLEECQEALIEKLARLLAGIIRSASEGEQVLPPSCDTIEPKTLEVDNV